MIFKSSKFRLCDLFGVPIYIDLSFAILLFLFTTSHASFEYGITCSMVLAISIVAHELGHSVVARLFGYRTKDITISLLGGCASLIALPRKATQEFATAIAGPLVSFAIAAAVYFASGFFEVQNDWLRFTLYYVFWLNVMLGGFNLLPGFPMDGGRIFRSLMRAFMNRPKATYIAMIVGRGFAILLGLSGLHAIFSGGGWGFIRLIIAWMIWQEGYREYLQARQEEDFRNWSQEDFNARVSPPPYGSD